MNLISRQLFDFHPTLIDSRLFLFSREISIGPKELLIVVWVGLGFFLAD